LKHLIDNILKLLSANERKKLSVLTLAELFINIADLVVLASLFYIIATWSQTGNTGFLPPVFREPIVLGSLCFFIFSLKNILALYIAKQQFDFVYEVATRISGKRTEEYLDSGYDQYLKSHSSRSGRSINQEPVEFAHYVLRSLISISANALLIIVTCVFILYFNTSTFLTLVLIFVPLLLILGKTLDSSREKTKLKAKISSERSMQYLQEAIDGYIEANVDQRKEFFKTRYLRAQQELNRDLSKQLLTQVVPGRILETGLIAGIIIYMFVQNGKPDLFLLGTFLVGGYKIFPGLSKIISGVGLIKTYQYTFQPANSIAAYEQHEKINEYPIQEIEISQLGYTKNNKIIFSNFDLKIKKGELLQLKGLSGRGKTTLINIILGFLEPSSGKILFNGKEFSSTERRAYWNRISYLKQDSFLIHDSILKNICFDQVPDEEKISRLTYLTGMNKCYEKHIGGINTILLENGRNVSGGERQRILLARALYKDADLIILDEPFNELDENAVLEMNEVLEQVASEGKMVLMISHSSAYTMANTMLLG